MKRTKLIIALALVLAAQTAAKADSRIARFCGPDHVNEAARKSMSAPTPPAITSPACGSRSMKVTLASF